MEEYLDRLLAALSHISPELVPDVRGAVTSLQRLETLHFETEESLFYPKLRPVFPDLLAQMDLQHQDIREVEQHVAEMLADTPEIPNSAGWMNCADLASNYMTASSTTSSMRKTSSSGWPAATTPYDHEILANAFKKIQSGISQG